MPFAIRVVAGAPASVFAFALDRFSKDLASASLPYGATLNVVGEWARLAHVHNSGTAFGMLPGSAPVLAFVSLPVLALIGWVYVRSSGGSLVAAIVLGLVLGAGAGNTIDRALVGYVEDFIDVGLPGGPRFWTFNLSDSALVLGILAALVPSLRAGRAPAPRTA